MSWLTKVPESIIQLFPDAIFWGTGFIALITISIPYAVFFVSMIESLFIYHILNDINENVQLISPNSLKSGRCKSGLEGVTLYSVKSILDSNFKATFLSYIIFMTSFIGTYIVGALLYLKDELQILGKSYGEQFTTRMYGSVAFFSVMTFITMSYRLLSSCDSALNIVVSLILGISVGALILLQNNNILGKNSLNMLGVPLLRKRTETGGNLYVCSPT
jgi:hypothetical protein